jgi:dipeptidase E
MLTSRPTRRQGLPNRAVTRHHIAALGGGGFSMEPDNPLLDRFILGLAKRHKPRVCFVPTASGDSDNYIASFYRSFPAAKCIPSHLPFFRGNIPALSEFLCAQDVIYVGGGNTANMLAVWRVHGMNKALGIARRAGVILCGVSAGALCWFEDGITDSFGRRLSAMRDGLGFLKGGFCPHYDGEHERRPALHRAVRSGFVPTLAADDGVALHFVNSRLVEAVSSRPKARAYRVCLVHGKVVEEPIPTRYLGNQLKSRSGAQV